MVDRFTFSVYCECADEDCLEEITLSIEEWNEAKSGPNRTIARVGHPLAAGEQVIAENERYVVAEGGIPPV